MTDSTIISKIWNLAGVLRDDGVGYGDYLEQITYLLFLKMADEFDIRHKCVKDEITVESVEADTLKNYLFPFSSKEEQNQVVQEIESRLSVCDKVEQSITESLEKVQALRQSILKKAFEDTLLLAVEIVACKQQEDYEPATVLLEKIKAEKKK